MNVGLLIVSAAGLIGALVVYGLKQLYPKKMKVPLALFNRQIVVTAWVLALLTLLLLVLWVFFSGKGKNRGLYAATLFGFTAVASTLLVHLLPQVLQKTGEFVAFNEDSIGTGTLFRVSGYLLGLLVACLLSLSIEKIFRRMEEKAFRGFALLWYLAFLVDLSLRGISSGARLGLFNRKNDFIFHMMILEDQSMQYTSLLYLVAVLLMAGYVFARHYHLRGEFETDAQRRKQRWWLRNCRRWSVSAVVFVLLTWVSVTIVNDYINRPVELAPAEEYEMKGETIHIPLTQIDDGHLHRFAYQYEGHNIRFIVVRKPGSNAYGVGLDACDICGIAGYFERNNDVICKRCDVVMNKATIGFKGGCNPVPFPYEIKDGVLLVQTAELQKEAKRFPVGE